MSGEIEFDPNATGPIPSIRQLKIRRFRGIERLDWQPYAGLNVIVGAGDTCKSTILEAIAVLFTPAPNFGLSEFDYYRRDSTKGFVIEAALAIGDGTALKGDKFPLPPLRGWKDGELTDLPDENGSEPILVCRLTGTPDFETVYEAIGADDETKVPLSRALRQRIGLLRLGVADRGDRDLRLVMGGALDRFLEGRQLRHSILQAILKTSLHDELGIEPTRALEHIEGEFKARSLPHPVRLGFIGTPGVSLAASVGLMVGDDDESALPLPAWGTGTRRLASLRLASILSDSISLAVIDEPESGLEPYRQRAFVRDLHKGGKRQAFVTTHSPAVLSEGVAIGAGVWRISPVTATLGEESDLEIEGTTQKHELTSLESPELRQLLRSYPEAILCRLPVICEGVTEVGFATKLLVNRFGESFSARGVFCVDAGGHDHALKICKKLIEARIRHSAVVDDEGRKSGSWKQIESDAILLQWEGGAALERAVLSAMPDSALPKVIEWPEEAFGKEVRHCLADLRIALGEKGKDKAVGELFEEYGRLAFVDALCQAACPLSEGKKKPRGWFKSFEGGQLLAEKLIAIEPMPERISSRIEAFLSSVDAATVT